MLGELGADVDERLYFRDKLTPDEVRRLARLLPGGVQDLVSTRSRRYRALGLAQRTLSPDQWVDFLAQEPGLWRRPVAVRGSRAVVGYDRDALVDLVD